MDTERISSEYQDLDAWSAAEILSALVDSNRRAVEAVAAAQPALEAAAMLLRERLERGGRLVYVGAGTSGRLALQDAAELPPTFGFANTVVLLAGGHEAGSTAREGAEDEGEVAVAEIQAASVGADDAVIGLAASGNTPYTVAAISEARRLGAATIGIANNAGTALLAAAEVPVLLATGPEVLAGSTRLAAGTAQKIALNALSTTVLVQLGGAYLNLMVGMQASNSKLRGRAAGIVAAATGLDEAAAARALETAGGDMRVAIVSVKGGVDELVARRELAANGNSVRRALAAVSG